MSQVLRPPRIMRWNRPSRTIEDDETSKGPPRQSACGGPDHRNRPQEGFAEQADVRARSASWISQRLIDSDRHSSRQRDPAYMLWYRMTAECNLSFGAKTRQ